MEKITFTFVIPACNVAPYVDDLIASIKNQTVHEFEAIVVCETSKDNTLEKLRAAIGGDPRFTVVELPCSGSASASRNYGIEHARSDYLVFVDGDDWIEPDSLARFAEAIDKYRPDLLLLNWTEHLKRADGSEKVVVARSHYLEPDTVYTGTDSLAIRLETYFQPGSPLAVCRREFLQRNHLLQVPGRRHQDCEWMPRVNFLAQRVVYLPYNYYHYRRRPGSVTTKANPKSITDLADNIVSFLDFRDCHKIPERLKRPLADWCGENFDCFFGANYRRSYAREWREHEFLRIAGTRAQFGRISSTLCEGGISKKILLTILNIARRPGGFAAAELLYHAAYRGVMIPVLNIVRRLFGKRS